LLNSTADFRRGPSSELVMRVAVYGRDVAVRGGALGEEGQPVCGVVESVAVEGAGGGGGVQTGVVGTSGHP
jgi:hypothetical protein